MASFDLLYQETLLILLLGFVLDLLRMTNLYHVYQQLVNSDWASNRQVGDRGISREFVVGHSVPELLSSRI